MVVQPAPYQAFEDEVAFLETYLGSLGGGGNAYVLGDSLHGLRWHVYVAAEHSRTITRHSAAADHSIEVCMTSLCPVKVRQSPFAIMSFSMHSSFAGEGNL